MGNRKARGRTAPSHPPHPQAERHDVRTVWKIFARDLGRLLRNPVALVVALGVCAIPSVYAWLNILANWDPYENTGTVPIVVVVEDEGADVPGMGRVDAGQMVRERLEENHQLGWTFVDDEASALDGVRAGRYYAAFVIPPDFTSSLASVLEGRPEPARVGYYVNEKANAVAPKVTDTGATTLETQVADEFVATAGAAVTERLQEAVGAAAGGSGAIVPNAEFVRGMVGFAVPENGHVAETARDFMLEKELRDEGVPGKVREVKRHGFKAFGDFSAFLRGNGRAEVVDADVQMSREFTRLVVLQTGAPRRIRAVDAKRAARTGETFAEARERKESFFAQRLDRLHARAHEDRFFALLSAAEEGVRDDPVFVRAAAREDRRMVHVGFGREGREIVRPLVVAVEKTAEHRHVNVGHAVGTKTVKAHDQKAGRSVVRFVRHVLLSRPLGKR